MDTIVAKLRPPAPAGPFVPGARIDNSQHNVVDMRTPTPMDYARFEDGSQGFVTDPNVGARTVSAGLRRWWPLPQGSNQWAAHPIPTGGGRVVHPK